MNENPYASPIEAAETLAEKVRPRSLPREMARVKWGLVWVLGSFVGIWFLILYMPYFHFASGNERVLGVTLYIAQTVGMLCCCRCPEAVVKRRKTLIAGSILLFGALSLGLLFSSPVELWGITSVTGGLLIGGLLWQVFLLKLALGIHSRGCALAASVVLATYLLAWILFFLSAFSFDRFNPMKYIVDIVQEAINMRFMDMLNLFGNIPQLLVLFFIATYPLLIVGLWWRIRGI